MKKWEYKEIFNIDAEELNKLGSRGWELVNAVVIPQEFSGEYYYIFKRVLEEK